MKKMRLFTAIVALVGVWALGGCGVSSPEPAVATRDTEITAKDSQYHSESTKAEKEAELRHAKTHKKHARKVHPRFAGGKPGYMW